MIKSKKWLALVPAVALVFASCGRSSDDGADGTNADGGDTVAESPDSVARGGNTTSTDAESVDQTHS